MSFLEIVLLLKAVLSCVLDSVSQYRIKKRMCFTVLVVFRACWLQNVCAGSNALCCCTSLLFFFKRKKKMEGGIPCSNKLNLNIYSRKSKGCGLELHEPTRTRSHSKVGLASFFRRVLAADMPSLCAQVLNWSSEIENIDSTTCLTWSRSMGAAHLPVCWRRVHTSDSPHSPVPRETRNYSCLFRLVCQPVQV